MAEKVCRGCGSTDRQRQVWQEMGYVNCCPEASMNYVIERDHGMPAMIEKEQWDKELGGED